MSLINDALKRANKVKPSDPMADVDAAPLHPVQENRTGLSLIWCTVAIMGAVLLASWAIVIGLWANRQSRIEAARTQQLIAAQNAPVTPKSQPAEPIASNREKPVELAGVAPAPVPAAVSPTPIQEKKEILPDVPKADPAMTVALGAPPAAVTSPVDVPKPVAPTFKLQAIFFKEDNASVMINSKTLRQGDKILNARVVSIARESVTLERDGEKLILELQMQ